jgi:CubicO group peptidase (beta-lactamase class C family)
MVSLLVEFCWKIMRRGIRAGWCFVLATLMVLVLAANTELSAFSIPPRTIPESIEQYLENAMQQWKIPGLAVAIIKKDRIFYTKGFGRSDAQHTITPDTPFIIGSLSKSLTATAVLQLTETGKIDLQAPVKRYLPWFRLADDHSDLIKIVDLLHHTSGLSMQTDMAYFGNQESLDNSLEDYVHRLATAKLSSPAGQDFNYANANYAILGMVVQQVSGMPYEKYIESHIFQPLEMQHSFTSQQQAVESSPPLATGYRFWFNRPVATSAPFDQQNLPAGYLISSARDIAHYLSMNLNGGRYQNHQIISAASLTQLHAPAVLAWGSSTYAMGWVNDRVNNLAIDYHGGELVNFSGNITLIPAQGWGIVILTNIFPGLIGDPIRKLYLGIVNILQGNNPPQLQIDLSNKLLVFGLPWLLFFQIGFFGRSLWQKTSEKSITNLHWWLGKVCLPTIIDCSIAMGFLVVLPMMAKVPFSIILLAQPDTAITAMGCSGVAICGLLRRIWLVGWLCSQSVQRRSIPL